MLHLENNAADRSIGAEWEMRATHHLDWMGKAYTRCQEHRDRASGWRDQERFRLLADLMVFDDSGQHHELKHKRPDVRRLPRSYGFEAYRLDHLCALAQRTQQPVYYTIHDWESAGAKHSTDAMANILQDWYFVDVCELEAYRKRRGLRRELIPTWIDGAPTKAWGYYWPVELWLPIHCLWGFPGKRRD